ncbi:MAG: hypothetical protein NTX64_09930 [Elusimicrobia bacterium]|nr:hypothetical protein [Elusimicrobiota bacterium]
MRKPMTKYWIFDEHSGQVHGPYWIAQLKTMQGFGPDTKLAVRGSSKPGDWKKARDIEEFQKAFDWAPSSISAADEFAAPFPGEPGYVPKPGEKPKP